MEVGALIAELIDPEPYSTIYDPTCGSGGLLIKASMRYEQRHPDLEERGKKPRLYGQELNPATFAIAKMNMFLHDYINAHIALGDTFTRPEFGSEGAGLQRFRYVVANPMWNQKQYKEDFFANDKWGRFTFGTPPNSSADWGWASTSSPPSRPTAAPPSCWIRAPSRAAPALAARIKSATSARRWSRRM